MAKEESEFQKLLDEAPMVPSADTVKVAGALSRSPDPTRFVLTLPNGESETLEVAAVKSAKKIAGAIGQSLVELELDAKQVPKKVIDIVNKPPIFDPIQTIWYNDPIKGGSTFAEDVPHHKPQVDKPPASELTIPPTREPSAPFVAAMPHQAWLARYPQAVRAKPPHLDTQVPPKGPSQDGTNAWNGFDITGLGGFDIITWDNGQAIYHYYSS